MDNLCDKCGKPTDNQNAACAGACASERHYGGEPLMGTTGLESCNCCNQCRDACHGSFMKSLDSDQA
jgi:hypothetical protein